MQDDSRKDTLRQAAGSMGPDSIEVGVRGRIREWVEELVEAELTAVLGKEASERGAERSGYRHGHRPRTLATSLGPTTLRCLERGSARLTEAPGNGAVRWYRGINDGRHEWTKRCRASI